MKSDPELLHPAWAVLRRHLEDLRRPIQDEIRGYPPPIPACDAHFNHLLEQRSALSREIVRLDAASQGADANGAGALEAFIRSSRWVDAETARQVRGEIDRID